MSQGEGRPGDPGDGAASADSRELTFVEPLGLPVSRTGEPVLAARGGRGGFRRGASGKSHPSWGNSVTLRAGQMVEAQVRQSWGCSETHGAQILLCALGAEEPGPSRGLG